MRQQQGPSTTSSMTPHSNRLDLILILTMFVIALVMRLYQYFSYIHYMRSTYGLEIFIDRSSGSYDRWLMDVLTIEKGGVYSHYKPTSNLAIVWLPLFQYVSILLMLISNSYSTLVPSFVNLILGCCTGAFVYQASRRLYGQRWLALAAGLVLAFQPWHIDYSILGTTKILLGLLICMMIYCFLFERMSLLCILSALAMLTDYEAWFIFALLLLVGFYFKHWNIRQSWRPILTFASVVIVWSAWSMINTGSPLSWLTTYLANIGWRPKFDATVLLFYFNLTLVMTFFTFFIGVVIGMLRSSGSRLIASTCMAYIGFYTLALAVGLDYGDIARIVVMLPIVAVLVPAALPAFKGSMTRRTLLVIALVLILVVPYVTQISIGPKKVYILMPDYRTGIELRKIYTGGRILADSPMAIYYSGIDPSRFLSYEQLEWYIDAQDPARLEDWLRKLDIRFIIWQKINYSRSWEIFPALEAGSDYAVDNITFTLVYEDSLRTHRWEHDPQWQGPPSIFVYKITYST